MSAVVGSPAQRRVRVGSFEPAAVAFLKQLDPAIVLLSLFLCEIVYQDRLTPALGAYSTLSFLLVGQLFNLLDFRDAERTLSDFSHSYCRTLLQWTCVIAVLLLVEFAFKATSDLSRKVVLTWFVATPLALSVSHALRFRLKWSAANGERVPRHVIVGVNNVGFELARRLPTKGFLGYFDFRSSERLAEVLEREQLAGALQRRGRFCAVPWGQCGLHRAAAVQCSAHE